MATRKNPATSQVVDEDEARGSLTPLVIDGITIKAQADPRATSERMGKRVLSAGSLDELFDSLSGKSSDDLVNKAFEFTSVEWQAYESDRGPIPQAICQVVDLSTGEATEFQTTAEMLVKFLFRAEQLGALPFRARIVEKPTRTGQKALNFERV